MPAYLPNIALCGKAGSGKSTVAGILSEHYGYRRKSFAAPLKEVAAMLWGPRAAHDREKLQTLGVAMREIDPDVWVNKMLSQLELFSAMPHGNPVVVDDLRFPNEFYALGGRDFIIARVEASEELRIERLKHNGKWQHRGQLDHETEVALDDYPAMHVIPNDTDDVRILKKDVQYFMEAVVL